jgi:hypothetical protein
MAAVGGPATAVDQQQADAFIRFITRPVDLQGGRAPEPKPGKHACCPPSSASLTECGWTGGGSNLAAPIAVAHLQLQHHQGNSNLDVCSRELLPSPPKAQSASSTRRGGGIEGGGVHGSRVERSEPPPGSATRQTQKGSHSPNSTHTGTWSDGCSHPRVCLSMPVATNRAAACSESRIWSMRMPLLRGQASRQ